MSMACAKLLPQSVRGARGGAGGGGHALKGGGGVRSGEGGWSEGACGVVVVAVDSVVYLLEVLEDGGGVGVREVARYLAS
jgi:hypothetical protein